MISAVTESQYLDILSSPKNLTSFLLNPHLDTLWAKHHPTQAKGLINRVQYWAEKKVLDIKTATEICGLFDSVFPEETFFVTCGENKLSMSKLFLMGKSDWFQGFFVGGFHEGKLETVSVEQFSSFLTLDLLQRLYIFLKHDKIESLGNLSEDELFDLIKQCHLWSLSYTLNRLQPLAQGFVTDAVKALETLEGARLYQLKDLEIHCLNVLSKSSVHLSVSADQSISATLAALTPDAEKIMSSVSSSLSSVSTKDETLSSPRALESLSQLSKLQRLTVTLTSQGISETAKNTLNQCTQLHSLRLQMRGGSLIAPPASSGGNPIQFSHIQQLDLRKLPGNPQAKRVALGALPLMRDLKDIRLAGCGFVDDKFLDELIRKKPDLTLIDLGCCHKVSDSKLSELFKVFSNLKVINLNSLKISNPTLSWALTHLSLLEHLNLTGCSHLRRGLFQITGLQLSKLKYLNLTSVHNVDEHDFDAIFSSAVNLEVLSVAFAKQFEVQQLKDKRMGALQEFIVSADKLEEADLSLIPKAFPNLNRLFVEGHATPELQDKLKRLPFSIFY